MLLSSFSFLCPYLLSTQGQRTVECCLLSPSAITIAVRHPSCVVFRIQLPLPHPHLRLLPSSFPLSPKWVLAYTYTVSMAEAGKMYKAGVLMKNKYKHAKKEADAAAAAARATAALPPRVTAADPDNVRGKRTHRAICLDVRERLLMGPGPDSQTAVMSFTSSLTTTTFATI